MTKPRAYILKEVAICDTFIIHARLVNKVARQAPSAYPQYSKVWRGSRFINLETTAEDSAFYAISLS